MSFANKVTLVTGASSGIGAATAILFAKEGANVAMVGRNQTKMKNVAEKVAKFGKKPLVIIADLAKEDEVARVMKETVGEFRKLDILVNNAGFATHSSLTEGNILKSYDNTMSVNVRAVIQLTALAAPHLAATKGNIINISSVAALTTPGDPTFICYYISKAALDQFTRSAARELAPKGIRVNSINPGPVKTDFFDNAGMTLNWDDFEKMTALNRASDSEELADLILFVASEKSKGMTGSCIVSDNGYLLHN